MSQSRFTEGAAVPTLAEQAPASPGGQAVADRADPAWVHIAAPAAAALAATLWGASFTFGKIVLRQLDPIQTVIWRFVLAALPFAAMVLWRRERLRLPDLPQFLLAAFLGVPALMLLQYIGLSMTAAATAALLIGTFPAVVAVAAVTVRHERLGAAGWGAVLLSTVGAAMIVGVAPGARGWAGPGLILLSMFAAAGWVLTCKRLMARYSAVATTAYTMLLGTMMLLPFDALSRQSMAVIVQVDGATWLGLLGLGVLCTFLAFCLANWGLRHMPAYRAGILNNLEPLTGALLGVAILHERLSVLAWCGGGLILLAALTVSLPPLVARAGTR